MDLLRFPIHAVHHPRRNMQVNGVLSKDNLGYAWQCNTFGHYVLVRPFFECSRFPPPMLRFDDSSTARCKTCYWPTPTSQNVQHASSGCRRSTRNPYSTPRTIGSSLRHTIRTKPRSTRSTSSRPSSKSAPLKRRKLVARLRWRRRSRRTARSTTLSSRPASRRRT